MNVRELMGRLSAVDQDLEIQWQGEHSVWPFDFNDFRIESSENKLKIFTNPPEEEAQEELEMATDEHQLEVDKFHRALNQRDEC